MATKSKKLKSSQEIEIEELVREKAYLNWLSATKGNPVSEADTIKFWVEAEKEVKKKLRSTFASN